jgi:hypothetical protein
LRRSGTRIWAEIVGLFPSLSDVPMPSAATARRLAELSLPLAKAIATAEDDLARQAHELEWRARCDAAAAVIFRAKPTLSVEEENFAATLALKCSEEDLVRCEHLAASTVAAATERLETRRILQLALEREDSDDLEALFAAVTSANVRFSQARLDLDSALGDALGDQPRGELQALRVDPASGDTSKITFETKDPAVEASSALVPEAEEHVRFGAIPSAQAGQTKPPEIDSRLPTSMPGETGSGQVTGGTKTTSEGQPEAPMPQLGRPIDLSTEAQSLHAWLSFRADMPRLALPQIGQRLPFATSQGLSPTLADVFEATVSCIKTGIEIRSPMLRALLGGRTREERLAALNQGVASWLRAARHRKISYQPATRVWQEWLSDNGPIGRLLLNFENGTLSASEAADAERRWHDEHEVRSRIRETDFALRQRLATTKEIEAAAAEALRRDAAEAAELFGEVAALLAATEAGPRHLQALLVNLRDVVRRATPSAAGCIGVALRTLGARLDSEPAADPRGSVELSAPLIGLDGVPLDASLQPREPLPPPEIFARMVTAQVSSRRVTDVSLNGSSKRCYRGRRRRQGPPQPGPVADRPALPPLQNRA